MAPKSGGSNQRTGLNAWARKWRDRPGGWWDEVVVGGARGDYTVADGLLSVDVWHPDYPGWTFMLTFAAHGAVVGFHVAASTDQPDRRTASPDAPSLTRRFLKDIPFGEIESAARQFVHPDSSPMPNPHLSHELRARYERAFADDARPGKRGRDDRAYAAAAAIYVEAGHDVRATAQRLHCSVAQARNILNRARHRGLLGAAPPGRAGGDLTDKAIGLLQGDNDGNA